MCTIAGDHANSAADRNDYIAGDLIDAPMPFGDDEDDDDLGVAMVCHQLN